MSSPPPPVRMAVLASRVRSDEKQLLAALDRRGARYEHIDSRLMWSFAEGPPRWCAVLNREIGHTRALYAARSLEALGVRVLNSAAAIEVCGDKWATTLALRRAALPTPRAALALTPQAALDAFDAIGYPAVVKPLVGSWGRLVSVVPDRRLAATLMEYVQALPGPAAHIVYVQELVQKPDRDIRAIVIGGELLGATYRRGDEWRTNVARGGVMEPCPVTPELAKLAIASADAVGADIAGVDLIEDQDGRLLVLEVNQGVEFSGFQQAMGHRVDVADRIVDHVLKRIASWSG